MTFLSWSKLIRYRVLRFAEKFIDTRKRGRDHGTVTYAFHFVEFICHIQFFRLFNPPAGDINRNHLVSSAMNEYHRHVSDFLQAAGIEAKGGGRNGGYGGPD